jgi:hypothetical protein
VLNDLYKPHTYDEIVPLVSPEVAARLDPSKQYGIWWYNRRNVTKSYGSEADGNAGRRYVTRTSVRTRDVQEWIAVPVPAYLPRKLVDHARLMIESRTGLERKHQARQWELKGVLRCLCGQNMSPTRAATRAAPTITTGARGKPPTGRTPALNAPSGSSGWSR